MITEDHARKIFTEHAVVQEMIDTEQSYNDTLVFLQQVLSKEDLVKNCQALINIRDIVPQLKVISDKLLDNVKKAMQPEIKPTERNALKEQRIQLLHAFFNVFPIYSNFYANFCIEKKANSARFKDIESYVKNNPKHLDLSGYLIQPTQRGPRYALLVSQAIKYNDKLEDENKGKLSAGKINDLKILLERISKMLQEANSLIPVEEKKENKPYQFGDITYATIATIYGYIQKDREELKPDETKSTDSEQRGYHFGDVSRSLGRGIYNSLWGTAPASSAVTTSKSNPEKIQENSSKGSDINEEEFEIISVAENTL
jgi:RhoGEF domain